MSNKPKSVEMAIEDAIKAFDYKYNIREESAYDDSKTEYLIEDIRTNGVNTPLVLHKNGSGLKGIRGYRRMTVIRKLREQGSKDFDKVPTLVYEGLSEAQQLDMMVDQGLQEDLTRFEVIEVAKRMFALGATEKEVSIKLHPLYIKSGWGRKPKNALPEDPKAREDALNKRHRQTTQNIKRLLTLPQKVYDAWREGLENPNAAFKVTDSQLQNLQKAANETKEEKGWDMKSNPGKAFEEKWEGFKNGDKAVRSDPSNPKVLTLNQIKQRKTIFNSEAFKAILSFVSGEDVPNIVDIDAKVYAWEQAEEKSK